MSKDWHISEAELKRYNSWCSAPIGIVVRDKDAKLYHEIKEAIKSGKPLIMRSPRTKQTNTEETMNIHCDKNGGLKVDGVTICGPDGYKPMNTFEERELHLERIVAELTTEQLFSFALWEIHAETANTSDVVSAELLRRSGVEEGLAKW